MALRSIKSILMGRDKMTEQEADDLIRQAKDALLVAIDNGDLVAAEEITYDYFGLEPDYLDQLMEGM